VVANLLVDVLLAAHLLAMNIASAGPLMALWIVRGRLRENAAHRRMAGRVACLSFRSLIVGGVLGGAMLLAPSVGLRAALGRFPANAYWFALAELAFSAASIAGLWESVRRRWPFWLSALFAFASASNLLYHFPPWMAVIGELAADPSWASGEVFDHRALLALWHRPEIAATWLHFVLASIAAAAVAAMWSRRNEDDESPLPGLATWALVATACQIPVGVWMVVSRNAAVRDALLGGRLLPTALFAAGVLAALALLQALLAVVLGEGQWAVRRSAWLLLIVTLLMTATLRHSRGPRQAQKNSPDLVTSWILQDR
jgi:hypothetical protein